MKEVAARFNTVHFGFYDAKLAPILEIDSGEEILINTVSADPADDVPPEWLPTQIRDIYARAQRGTGPHILTGPIRVRSAMPGNVLQVDILDIRLTQRYGYNIVSPLKGMFGAETPMQKTTIIPIDLETGLADIAPGLRVPTRPFFGQMGVAPPKAWGRLDSRPPNKYGGNIDNKELVAGTRLFLPVWVEGALFSTGDGHAAQGDGEINQTVSREHARILYDEASGELRLRAEPGASSTRIFREGRSIEVSGRDSRGVKIQSGDEIYFGRASVKVAIRS